MKALKIISVILIVLFLLAGIGGYIFIKTFDANRYKPQIIQLLSSTLHRQVNIDAIALRFQTNQGFSLEVKELTIVDAPAFSTDNFLHVKSIYLGIDALRYWTQREIFITSIMIQKPEVKIIRNREGLFNVPGMPVAEGKLPSSLGDAASSVEPKASSPAQAPAGLPVVVVQSLKIDGGSITFRDQMSEPGMIIPIEKIDLLIKNFSLTAPVSFHLEGALFSPQKNLFVDGELSFDLVSQKVLLRDFSFQTNLSQLELSRLVAAVPSLKQTPFPQTWEGQLQVAIDDLVASAQGLQQLSLQGKLEGGKVFFKDPAILVEAIQASWRMDERDVTSSELTARLAKGTIKANAQVADYRNLQKGNFSFKASLDSVDIADILAQQVKDIKVEGVLQGNIQGKGKISGDVVNSLTADGDLRIDEGVLRDVNILRLALEKISMIPNLVERLEEKLPEKYKEKMKLKDTFFNKIQGEIGLRNGELTIHGSEVETDGFLLRGEGKMGLAQTMAMTASLGIVPDLSLSMTEGVEELKYLMEKDGSITFPVGINGKIPRVTVTPDLEYLGKKILSNRGREELDRVLDKVFGDDAPATGETSSPSDPSAQPQEPEKKPERQLIEGVLDTIFQ